MGNILPVRRERIGCGIISYSGVAILGGKEHRRDVSERLVFRRNLVMGCNSRDEFCGRHVVRLPTPIVILLAVWGCESANEVPRNCERETPLGNVPGSGPTNNMR